MRKAVICCFILLCLGLAILGPVFIYGAKATLSGKQKTEIFTSEKEITFEQAVALNKYTPFDKEDIHYQFYKIRKITYGENCWIHTRRDTVESGVRWEKRSE